MSGSAPWSMESGLHSGRACDVVIASFGRAVVDFEVERVVTYGELFVHSDLMVAVLSSPGHHDYQFHKITHRTLTSNYPRRQVCSFERPVPVSAGTELSIRATFISDASDCRVAVEGRRVVVSPSDARRDALEACLAVAEGAVKNAEQRYDAAHAVAQDFYRGGAFFAASVDRREYSQYAGGDRVTTYVGGLYRHYKGALYRVLMVVRDSTNARDGRRLVVYVSDAQHGAHARDEEEFHEAVCLPGFGGRVPRFTLVEADE